MPRTVVTFFLRRSFDTLALPLIENRNTEGVFSSERILVLYVTRYVRMSIFGFLASSSTSECFGGHDEKPWLWKSSTPVTALTLGNGESGA